jgi:hypothetical protein
MLLKKGKFLFILTTYVILSCNNTRHDVNRSSVKEFIDNHISAFENGDFDNWGAGMNENVFLIAADPFEAIEGRKAIVAEMHKDFDPAFKEGLKLDIKVDHFHTGISSKGKTAWDGSILEYKIIMGTDTLPFIIRTTNILVKKNDKWEIVVANYSRQVTDDPVKVFTDSLPPPAPIENKIPEEANNLAKFFSEKLNSLSQLAMADSVFIIGPAMNDHLKGKSEVTGFLKNCDNKVTRRDGLRAGLSDDGETGWVITNLDLKITGQIITIPYRAVFAFEKEGNNWVLVMGHISIGLKDPG